MALITNPRYLVVVYVVTSGLHGEDLGSDEEEIVMFAWLVLDITDRKVKYKHLIAASLLGPSRAADS